MSIKSQEPIDLNNFIIILNEIKELRSEMKDDLNNMNSNIDQKLMDVHKSLDSIHTLNINMVSLDSKFNLELTKQ